jgi:hypothetical protein
MSERPGTAADRKDPPEERERIFLLLSGLAGLLACALLAAGCAWLVSSASFHVLVPFPNVALLVALVLGSFSLAEIPMMVFLMRRLLAERKGNLGVVVGLNALYIFFAAVYGAPVLLLTGSLGWGLALCSLGLVRLASSLLFVRPPAPTSEVESGVP